jgi:hypothetical protein
MFRLWPGPAAVHPDCGPTCHRGGLKGRHGVGAIRIHPIKMPRPIILSCFLRFLLPPLLFYSTQNGSSAITRSSPPLCSLGFLCSDPPSSGCGGSARDERRRGSLRRPGRWALMRISLYTWSLWGWFFLASLIAFRAVRTAASWLFLGQQDSNILTAFRTSVSI